LRPITLAEKWGTKEIWLRILYVRIGLIWLFREEITQLELNESKSLAAIFDEAYRIANKVGREHSTDDAALEAARVLLQQEIDRRREICGDDSELQRLRSDIEIGLGFDPLHRLFDTLAKKTRDLYGAKQCRQTTLLPIWLNEHPLGALLTDEYLDRYHVTAATNVDPDGACVELQVHLDNFDVFSFLVIPRLLSHELVCHAHAREDRNSARSLWAEGVMDWVASFLLNKWLARLELPLGAAITHTAKFGERRTSRWRKAGHYAAEELVAWLMNDPTVRTVSIARYVVVRLAVEVNLYDAALPEKDLFASRLLNVSRDEALQLALSDWRQATGSVGALLVSE
jgi:hypothetical protein